MALTSDVAKVSFPIKAETHWKVARRGLVGVNQDCLPLIFPATNITDRSYFLRMSLKAQRVGSPTNELTCRCRFQCPDSGNRKKSLSELFKRSLWQVVKMTDAYLKRQQLVLNYFSSQYRSPGFLLGDVSVKRQEWPHQCRWAQAAPRWPLWAKMDQFASSSTLA